MSSKKNIAIVTGGYSGENVISYKSCATIVKNLDTDKWNGFVIDITPNGWFCNCNEEKIEVNKNDFSINHQNQKITFDAVLFALHGTPGEDGKLQGYFDMLNIPYTGCNAATSAITFNKRYTVAVAKASGINVSHSILYFKHEYTNGNEAKDMKFPLFVKPNNGGSSIGMSKIFKPEEVEEAIAKAFKEDDQVLVEEFISGREFTMGVYKKGKEIICLPPTEVIAENVFFDFEAKYQGKSKEITPAPTTPEQLAKLQEAGTKIYKIFNCNGVVRIDFIYNEEKNEPFMLEINTIPGQSDASIIPQQVQASGGNLKDFYSALIESCLAK